MIMGGVGVRDRRKETGVVGWGRLMAAVVFLFNPNVGLVDFLPDFIGHLLICSALARVAFIDEHISEARGLFRRAALITLGRFAALFVTFGLIPFSDRSTMMLLMSFVFDVAELCTVIPALSHLSDGIMYLSERHGGELAYRPASRRRGENGKNVTQRMISSATVFVIAKAVLGTLPELSTLSGQGYDTSHWYEYLGMFRVLGFAVSLVFGIVFLCRALRYIKFLGTERDFHARLAGVYDSVMAEHPDYLARRAVLASFVYFSIGAALTADFGLDGLSAANGGTLGSINVIPDVLSAVCLLVGLLIIRKYITNRKNPLIFASVYTFVTAAYTVLQYYFASKYYIEAVGIDPKTNSVYMLVCCVAVVCALLFAATLISLMKCAMEDIIRTHTGFSITARDSHDPGERVHQLHRELTRKTIPVMCVGVLAAALEALSVCLVSVVGFLWIFALVADIVFAVMFIKLLGEIRVQIDYKYMLS